MVRTGLEVFLRDGADPLQGRRVGLVTNHTGVNRELDSSIDLLRGCGRIELAALFGPEHGVRGAAQAGVQVSGSKDERTGLPIHSLYGETRKPAPEMLAGLGALIYDIQDVGVRYATYLSTLYNCQEAAEDHLLFVVLDRPNPLSGARVEGNVLDPAFRSFVGTYPIATRHGMTAGELARLFAAENGWPEPLIVGMEGWNRAMWYDETALPWVQPSPNLPTLDSTLLYPGTCLLEGTNLSEGRGTTRPFETVGAPWLDPFKLSEDLNNRGLPGVRFRPNWFTPVFSKHAGELCGGVQVHITDREALRPAALGVHTLHALREQGAGEFQWLGKGGRYFVDLLFGSDQPRLLLDGGASPGEVMGGWESEIGEFEDRRRKHLLYE